MDNSPFSRSIIQSFVEKHDITKNFRVEFNKYVLSVLNSTKDSKIFVFPERYAGDGNIIPKDTMIVLFNRTFNQPLIINNVSIIPNTVRVVFFGEEYNHPLIMNKIRALPDSIMIVLFGTQYNMPIVINNKRVFPDNLIAIHFDIMSKYNKPLVGNYHKRCTQNNIQQDTDADRENIINPNMKIIMGLPAKLMMVQFGRDYNLPLHYVNVSSMNYVKCLPDSMISIRLGTLFNQDINTPIGSVFGRKLKYLVFGSSFNRPLYNVQLIRLHGVKRAMITFGMPKSMEYIEFGNDFNQYIVISGVSFLPKVRYIKFGNLFNKPIIGAFREGLEILKFGLKFNQPFEEDGINGIPSSLKHLDIGGNFNESLFYKNSDNKILPDSLKVLYLSQISNTLLIKGVTSALPKNLEELYFSSNWNCQNICARMVEGKIIKILPDNLKVLYLSDIFNSPLSIKGEKLLPDTITTLKFGDKFDQSLFIDGTSESALPKNIKNLIFGSEFKSELLIDGKMALPDDIECVTFGRGYVLPKREDKTQLLFPSNINVCYFGSFQCIKNITSYPELLGKIKIQGITKKESLEYSNQLMTILLCWELLPLPIAEEVTENFEIIYPAKKQQAVDNPQ